MDFKLTQFASGTGCAAKLPLGDLNELLGTLAPERHPDLLVGTSLFDDAGVIRFEPDRALVQTVDFLPPVVDDPVWFGRIAVTHTLSDLYAMGATPFTALGIVGWPQSLPTTVLAEVLRGGQEKLDEAGVMLVGGHSVRDAEVKYGLAVTGFVDPDRIQTNKGAKEGDLLVVTKPLGMGAISTGIARARISSEVAMDAMTCMATLNKDAMEVAVEVGVDAMTDVGGYGIAGHANEMAEAAGLTVELELKRMPLFEQALELVRTGMHSNAFSNTRAYLGSRLGLGEGVDSRLVTLALDAETSGGLLLAVDKAKVDALCDGLRARGTPAAAIVGRFVARRSCPVVLV